MAPGTLATSYRVRAFNTAAASENKIHDDAMAKRFGFAGGLVPGIEVYAYMTHMVVARWGRTWLETGGGDCRFLSPVYDGRNVDVTAADANGGLVVKLSSDGTLCATGSFGLMRPADGASRKAEAPEPPSERPQADELSLAVGTRLGIRPFEITANYATAYLRDVREEDPLYAAEHLAHPGIVLRLCNQALVQNVVLGPWIHVGSAVRNLSAAKVGDMLSLCAEVVGNYENKGHKFVDLDILVSAGDRPIAKVTHHAIYRPRQVAERA
jgi:hypothetical protein